MTANGKKNESKQANGRKFNATGAKSKRNFEAYSEECFTRAEEAAKQRHWLETDSSAFNKLFTMFGANIFKTIQKPNSNDKTETWTTRHQPTEPRELKALYEDKDTVIGMRFNTLTGVAIFDIDPGSPNHPHENRAEFDRLRKVLEDIGLARYTIVQSSFSTGIHLYIAFPSPQVSIVVAHTLLVTLANHKFVLGNGKLEVFPNRKEYGETKPTLFKGLRLPLQPDSGSFVLDPITLEPVHNDLNAFVAGLEHDAQHQDMETFTKVMKHAYEDFSWVNQWGRKKLTYNGAEGFYNALQTNLKPGWTGFGQTNDLIPHCVKLVFVFEHKDGEELVSRCCDILTGLPGYEQYCRHKHNLRERVRDWLKFVKNAGYYFYTGEYRPREGVNYGEGVYAIKTQHEEREDGRKHNKANAAKQQASSRKLAQTIREIRNSVRQGIITAPQTLTDMMRLVMTTAKALFGSGFSMETLQRFKGLIVNLQRSLIRIAASIAPSVASVEEVQNPPVETAEPASEANLRTISTDSPENSAVEIAEISLESQPTDNPPIYEGFEALGSPSFGAYLQPPASLSLFSYQFPFRLGDTVRFQHESFQGWRKGTVVEINTEKGYFVNCLIKFNILRRGQWITRFAAIYNYRWVKSLTDPQQDVVPSFS